jgi:hypothetical protein
MTSWQMVMFLTAGACVISLILFTVFYRSSPTVDDRNTAESARVRFSRQEILLVLIASFIWTLFNAGFIAIIIFALFRMLQSRAKLLPLASANN